jgi:mycofactocin glycosyltransferase
MVVVVNRRTSAGLGPDVAPAAPSDASSHDAMIGRSVRLRLDSSYRRPDDGSVIIGGSPLRVLTLTAGGTELVRMIERGAPVAVGTRGAARLIDRLVELGIVHPHPEAAERFASGVADGVPVTGGSGESGVTIVTPWRRASPDDVPPARPWPCTTILVDDASEPPARPIDGVELVRLDLNVGPGGARNAGLDRVDTPFVAFVDADVDIEFEQIRSLLPWFDDPRVALVAPRIRAGAPGPIDTPGRSGAMRHLLARFEQVRSPLDLGGEPARVAPTTRVSYVPSAVIVCRTEAIRSIEGFDPSLRWGEDVDLVWRLHEAGWRCRYEPTVVAHHRTRGSLGAWVAQRFRYGTSAAPLAERHPGALAPVRMSGWSAATWAPAAAGCPLIGATIGIGTAVALVRKLRQVPAAESFRLAGLGNLHAGRLIAATLTRSWWPIGALLAVASRRARRVVLLAVIVPIVLDRRADRPDLDPVRYAALHLLDDLSYGAGVWAGAWHRRSPAALLPSFESWPPRTPSSDGGADPRPGSNGHRPSRRRPN